MLGRPAASTGALLRSTLRAPALLRPSSASSRFISSSSSPRQQQPQQPSNASDRLPEQPTVADPFLPPTQAEIDAVHPSSSPSPSPTPAPPAEPVPPPPATPVLEPEPVPEPAAPVSRVRRPVGAFRGGIIGFLAGVTLVGSYGYFQLLDDYSRASRELLASVEELKGSTEQMASHLSRISTLESTTTSLSHNSATKPELNSLRAEYRKLLEAEHLDVLNLKAHVWALEQDLYKVSRRETSVRI
ncbi:hypothetical protein JCM8547_000033 [Rhodosporidiobolus lusitaniae]